MRFPVKVCVGLPAWLHRVLRITLQANPRALLVPAANDARPVSREIREAFSRTVAVLGSGTTWKSTGAGRHPLTDELILRECKNATPVILDVGVSDGITSFELIEKLGGCFSIYYVTDVSFRARYSEAQGNIYFYGKNRECTMIATKHLVIFSALSGAIAPFDRIARRVFRSAPDYDERRVKEVSLVNPGLSALAAADSRIRVREYDMLDRWGGDHAQVIKIANVLNRDYFADQVLRRVLANLKQALSEGGKLFVTDNRLHERVSVFTKQGDAFVLSHQLNGGSDITDIAASA